jgi:hypothetical protein
MKSHRILFGLLLLLLTVGLIFFVPAFLNRRLVYATPETESAFLKSYNPEAVVKAFARKQGAFGWTGDMAASAGEGFASHHGGFHGRFEIEAKDWTPLMAALTNDVPAQLSRSGAKLLGGGGGPDAGSRFNYQEGKNLGVVIVAPLRTRTEKSTAIGGTPVDVDIYLDETWVPNLRNKP